jgi:hypothetical protein
MRRGKLRAVIVVAVVVMLLVTLLPSTVLAHEFCRFYGPVKLCGENAPPGTVVSAWLEDPYVGPWNSTMYYQHGETWYYVDVPRDDPSTPGKEGGVEGDTVHFSVNYTSTTIVGPNATWESARFIYHPLRLCGPLCPLHGDANMDGVVNMADVTKVERIIFGLDAVTPCADVNGDGVINMADVTKIKQIIFGIDC